MSRLRAQASGFPGLLALCLRQLSTYVFYTKN
ncbi:unnamed protein product [Ectocarpus sp. 12 AP-2014]